MTSTIDRRTFLYLTGGALAGIGGVGAMTPRQWSDAVIVNALGGLADPNRPASSDTGGQGTNDDWAHGSRVLREAAASGLTAVNLTLGYVAGEGEPFEATIRDLAS